MDVGPRSCEFCTKSFPSIDKWTLHYNSQHSTEYRAPIFGHHTCKNCYKFISTERWSTHSCRKPASKTRADATPTTRVGPPASEGPTNMSVDLETYLIPLTEPAARVPTATSTPRVSSIVGAPDDGTQGRSSFFPNEEQRGDILEPLKAGVDPPVRHLGTSGAAGGDPPSKPTTAGPSAGSSDSATRSLRSASATVSSKTVDGRKKEGSGPPTSVKDGGLQPPPSVGEVSGRPARGVSHAPTRSSSRAASVAPAASGGKKGGSSPLQSQPSLSPDPPFGTQVEQSNTQVEQSSTQVERSTQAITLKLWRATALPLKLSRARAALTRRATKLLPLLLPATVRVPLLLLPLSLLPPPPAASSTMSRCASLLSISLTQPVRVTTLRPLAHPGTAAGRPPLHRRCRRGGRRPYLQVEPPALAPPLELATFTPLQPPPMTPSRHSRPRPPYLTPLLGPTTPQLPPLASLLLTREVNHR